MENVGDLVLAILYFVGGHVYVYIDLRRIQRIEDQRRREGKL